MMIINALLAQVSPNDLAGLIVVVGTFILAIFLAWAGFNLLKSGSRPEKGGGEFLGLKFNIETTTGGICVAFAAIVVIQFLSKFYN